MTTKDTGTILQRFNALYTFYTPALVENQQFGDTFVIRRHEDGWLEGRGYVMRVSGTGYTVCVDGDWITVYLSPFGLSGRIPIATLPATFEGIPIHYHCERETPLAPEELVFREFADLFTGGRTGEIEGAASVVQLGCCRLSCNTAPQRAKEYGCQEDEVALLVDWLPTDMEVDAIIREFPSMPRFPRAFKGLKVYYKRDEPVVAH